MGPNHGPGLHYHRPYPIETVLLPKITQVNQLQLGIARLAGASNSTSHERQMLTGDENIVEADCAVSWRIKDAGKFLFKIDHPEAALKVVAESALREIISRTPIQAAMSDKREQVADQTRDLLQTLLDEADSGILVTQVQLQRVDPPSVVIDAFNDVQRARADQERTRNEAEAYANDIIPRARGEASHIAEESEAYKSQVINLAQGDAKSFELIYASYARDKDVTAWRLYLESVDEVLKKATKVIIDTSGKGVTGIVPYMPLAEKEKPDSSQGAAEMSAKRRLALAAGAFFLLWLLSTTLYTVSEVQQALIVRLGAPVGVVEKPGLKFKLPMVDTVIYYDSRLLTLEPAVEQVILGDQKRIEVQTYTRFRIANPLVFYNAVRTVELAEPQLAQLVSSSLRRELGQVTLPSLLSEDRIAHRRAIIEKEVADKAKDVGIESSKSASTVPICRWRRVRRSMTG